MNRIAIKLPAKGPSRDYHVLVGENLLPEVARWIAKQGIKKIFILLIYFWN